MKPLRQQPALRGKGKAKETRTTSWIVRDLVDDLTRRGLSQASVAEAIGVAGASLSGWKRGRSSPNLVTAEAFAQVLGYRLVLEKIDDDRP